MKTTFSRALLFTATFVAGCFAATSQMLVPQARAQDSRRFDYYCTYVGQGASAFSKDSIANETGADLKTAGAQGWELVSLDHSLLACFKRPL